MATNSGIIRVNGYPVIAELADQTSDTTQSIVVCDRGSMVDQYVVWTVAQTGGWVKAWNGYYTNNLSRALDVAFHRATP